ncbi:MAG: SUMF1/EgtB/PvdO family nonheme iron enzyme [Gammaproteobacteria bacterium]|nr:SUMF1/EgtB/PvdO family nonheme iron enzyme [Gammaproteobacteria bacterium]
MQNGDILTINAHRYRLEKPIAPGTGSYGQVWAATDASGHPVALKFLNTERMAEVGPEFHQQWHTHMEREIAFLDHLHDDEAAHIVKLLNHGDIDGQPVLVLERMQTNLDQWIKTRSTPMGPRQIVDWAWQILAGLTTVHAHQLIYRDLKLSNVLVGDNGQRLKLADFGTLKPQREDGTVSFAGTLSTMAPEQLLPANYENGQPVYQIDYRIDYYALGLILFTLFTGQKRIASCSQIEQFLQRVGLEGAHREGPLLGGLNDEEQQTLQRVLETSIIGDATFGPDRDHKVSLVESLHRLIVKLLAPRKEDRPESAEEIRTELETALAALPLDPGPPPHTEPSATPLLPTERVAPFSLGGVSPGLTPHRPRWVFPLLGMTALAGLLGLGFWWMRPDVSPPVDTSAPLVELATPKPAVPIVDVEPVNPPEPVAATAPPRLETAEPALDTLEPDNPEPDTLESGPPPPIPADPDTSPLLTPIAETSTTTVPTLPVEPTTPGSSRAQPSATPGPIPVPAPTAAKPAPVSKPTHRPSSTDGVSPVVIQAPISTVTTVSPAVERPPPTLPPMSRDPLGGGRFAPEMVIVPAGTLILPSVNGQPERTVTIQPFALASRPVTFADYDLFARQTDRSPPYGGGLPREERATHPVRFITWYEAHAYVEWLSQRTGQRYRLPSEIEWTYAEQANIGERGAIPWEWVADCASNDCNRHQRRGKSGQDSQPADQGGQETGFRIVREL